MRVSFFKFQSTYPHGVRRAVVFPKTSEYRFQSTYPHGVRRQLLLWRAPPAEFQSTYPHGVRRPVKIYTRPRITISIHVPARGTTPARSTLQGRTIFQSTYPHGVRRQKCWLALSQWYYFNPRTRTGYDLDLCLQTCIIIPISIHVPARGTTCSFNSPTTAYEFQSTYRTGYDTVPVRY